MNTFQIVMLSLAGVVGLSAFWDRIKTLALSVKLPDATPTVKEIDPSPAPQVKPLDAVVDKGSLAEVVVCWESLQDKLEARGLNKASVELTKIFPLLIQTVDIDPTKPAV